MPRATKTSGYGQPSGKNRNTINVAIVIPKSIHGALERAIAEDEASLRYTISRANFVTKLIRAELERRGLLNPDGTERVEKAERAA